MPRHEMMEDTSMVVSPISKSILSSQVPKHHGVASVCCQPQEDGSWWIRRLSAEGQGLHSITRIHIRLL